MATAPQEIDDVRRRMAQIRRELHEDVKGVVEGAEAATDWRRYVRNYPWATTGLALAIGYLVIPRRHKPTTIQISHAAPEAAKAVPSERPRDTPSSSSSSGSLRRWPRARWATSRTSPPPSPRPSSSPRRRHNASRGLAGCHRAGPDSEGMTDFRLAKKILPFV